MGFAAAGLLAAAGSRAAEPDAGAAEAAPPPDTPRFHVVEPDETLWRISVRNGVTLQQLMDANGIDDPSVLQAGTRLVIPDPEGGTPAPPPVSAAPPALWPVQERADALLSRAERKLAAAHFEEALELTEQARALLAPISDTRRAQPRLAALEVSAGTVYVAMARREEAVACFRRAIEADPELELDPALTSPKILRVFREARSGPSDEDAP